MESYRCKGFTTIVFIVLILAIIAEQGQGQDQGPGQGQDQGPGQGQGQGSSCPNTFFSSLVQLIPCRTAVSPLSPVPPTETCCSAVRAIGQPCLCVLVNGPPISGVDRGMALELPQKCAASFEPCELARK